MHEECSRGWALKLGEFLGGGEGGEKTKKEGEHRHIGWPRGGLAAYAGGCGRGHYYPATRNQAAHTGIGFTRSQSQAYSHSGG